MIFAKKTSDGFTLIELLVAITIFSLVVGMAMFALRHSFTIARQIDAPFAEETQRYSRMRDCISSMFNYVTSSRDIFNNKKDFATFFTGEAESMTFISCAPPSGRGMAICKMLLIKDDVFLIEAPLYSENTNYMLPTLENDEKKNTLIASGVTSLRFEYLYKGKNELTLKGALPSRVRMAIVDADGKESEFFFRVMTNYDDKTLSTKGSNDTI